MDGSADRREDFPMRLALVYDMNACRTPTGVTRHALGQLGALAAWPDVDLRLVSGRIHEPDGLIVWDRHADRPRHELPFSTRTMLRAWRVLAGPPVELWTRAIDWAYAPAEYLIPTRKARRAVTSHDVLQDLTYGGERRRALLRRVFERADLIASVSDFNTARLVDAFPACRDRVVRVPNAADDLFFDAATAGERSALRERLGLGADQPYLLSVANFQPRKNLTRLVRAAGLVPAVARGDVAVVLVGAGDPAQTAELRAAAVPGLRLLMPGYLEGRPLRAAYAGARALVFPSTCESFGIPAVEAMAQGCPVALADSTALPEVGGDAGWYFDPASDESLAAALRDLLDDRDGQTTRRVALGRERALNFRWDAAAEALVAGLNRA
jgi:alpha-1,3-rhamnosyl/mannosyltransferase